MQRCRQPRAALPPTQATSAPTKRPRHQVEPGVHVIFVGISHHKDIGEEGHDCRIPCDPAVGSFEAGDVLGGLTPERLQQLEDSLSPGLVSNIGPREKQKYGLVDLTGRLARLQKSKPKLVEPYWNELLVLLPQQILTMLWAERSQRMTIEYRTLDWIMGLIKEGDALQHLFNDISVITGYHESWNYGYRIADIRTLDSIAVKDSTPEKYRHRPKACLSIGDCRLDEIQGPQFVRFAFSEREDYIHHSTAPNYNTFIHSQPYTQGSAMRVIHQQCFPSVSEWGYLCVFMVSNQIIARSFSSCDQRTKYTTPRPFVKIATSISAPMVFDNIQIRVKCFCKWWQQQLTAHDPELFESLNIGCIMRIGLSEASLGGKFFIIGIQRWFASPFFSMDLTAKPFDQLFKAFGEQFARVYGSFAAKDVPDN
ncbi:hypothetical protein DER46DRAFT_702727 [Fusarium sp. MPI-SDFR-AT-0072]|nr:hypothetical protein DER46DRAFT_702727 [Fusarium sp. MPI-SDFR-AT-0072]